MRSAWSTRPASSVPASRSPNTGKGFTGLSKRLGSLGVAGVAIERSDGPLVEAMLEADLRVVMVTPRQVKSLRSRYRASGAKSDPADAYLLADVLRTDGHRLAALTPDSEPTKILRALSRTRKDLVEARVALVNQLTSQLEGCFPGAIGLFHELHSPTAVAFLRRYPPATPPPPSPRPPSLPSCAACTTAAARPPASCSAACRPPQQSGSARPRRPDGRSACWPCWTPSRSPAARNASWKPRSSSAGGPRRLRSTSSPACPGPATGSGRRRCWPSSATCVPASLPRKPWPPRSLM